MYLPHPGPQLKCPRAGLRFNLNDDLTFCSTLSQIIGCLLRLFESKNPINDGLDAFGLDQHANFTELNTVRASEQERIGHVVLFRPSDDLAAHQAEDEREENVHPAGLGKGSVQGADK